MDDGSARRFMDEAIRLAGRAVRDGRGGPFGAVVVKDGAIIGQGINEVIGAKDATAHAEMLAIRAACRRLGSHRLDGCALFSSCEPCPMCEAAVLWARIERVYFAATREDAARAGFDDELFHRELHKAAPERRPRAVQLMREEARAVMSDWAARPDRRLY